jgi:hypothetical protein
MRKARIQILRVSTYIFDQTKTCIVLSPPEQYDGFDTKHDTSRLFWRSSQGAIVLPVLLLPYNIAACLTACSIRRARRTWHGCIYRTYGDLFVTAILACIQIKELAWES